MDKVESAHEVIAPVVKTIRVNLAVEAAFRLFTEEISRWWPLASHSVGGDDAETCILEGKVGGRFYEVQKDGAQSDWGRVFVWEPPHKVSFTMYPGKTPEFATKVEVSFAESEFGGTTVALIHRGWERFGERGLAQRNNYDGGWDTVLEKFISFAQPG
jgi:hypothetical protein